MWVNECVDGCVLDLVGRHQMIFYKHALKIVMGLNVGLWGERCVLSACADWLIANVCQLYVTC